MQKGYIPKTKPSVNNFDINSLYDVQEKIQVSLYTDKFNNSLRPKPMNPLNKPIPKPTKDLSFYHPGREEIRDAQNTSKNIPHKDYEPIYVPPYYNIKETGFTHMRQEDIFRKN
jgi:hypothetical protein